MPIYRITTKKGRNCNGVRVEPGMSVEVTTNSFSHPVSCNGGAEVEAAFMRVHGISLKQAGMLSTAWLDVQKLG